VAAKGGNYLLNVGPTAEGLIPPESVERLAAIGDWMDVNAEAIYGSRLWTTYREGETIRYTYTGGAHVYAVSLVWPGTSLVLRAVEPEPGSEIYLLGHNDPLAWTFDAADSLTIAIPDALQDEAARPGPYAYVFKIRFRANRE
jgi:alpha-L-fucosidase